MKEIVLYMLQIACLEYPRIFIHYPDAVWLNNHSYLQ